MPITAPYHFVPLSKWTCLPDWAASISHDQPFADGISGQLEIEIKNHSPLLIGADDRDGNEIGFVKDPTGAPYIPGSSLRGMIRNVLEIASFADMTFVDDARFGVRDISSSATNYFTYYNKYEHQAGWLKFNGKNWVFSNIRFVDITYENIKKLAPEINNTTNPIEKYKAFPLDNEVSFSVYTKTKRNRGEVSYAQPESSNAATDNGCLVFVGAMNKKVGDYIFYPPKNGSVSVDSKIIQDFHLSHKDYGGQYSDSNKQTLYEYLQKNLHPLYGMPVFALKDKLNGNIVTLGLAKMMKIAVPNGIHKLLNQYKSIDQNNSDEIKARRVDLVQSIFGMTRDKAGYSLKSRVSFSDAAVQGSYTILTHLGRTVLGGPKASYFPAYLEQTTDKSGVCRSYQDYFTHNAQLSGWKRYPARNTRINKLPSSPNKNEKVTVNLRPIDAGVMFRAKIRFHNLKKIELGAILWALNFNGKDNSFHSLGMGKPFGFGLVKIQFKNNNYKTCNGESLSSDKLITCFTEYMDTQYQQAFREGHWSESPQIKNLLAMLTSVNDSKDFSYMGLTEYTESKTKKKAFALLAYQGIPRKNSQLKKSGGQENNYNFFTETVYGREQAERFRQEEIQIQKEQEDVAKKIQHEAELEAQKANASEVTKQVLDAIDAHKNESSFSLDAICELIINEPDLQAAQTFIDYISSEGKAWKAVKQKAKKQKRRAWLDEIQVLIKK